MKSVFTPKHLNFKTSEVKKQKGIYCAAYGCKNPACAKKRGLCHKHYHVHRRMVDPVYNRFTDFRKNALKRCKEFTITLEEFRGWCNETGYIITKGMRGFRCTIDRIDNRYGYHIWNIQILTHAMNIKKYHEVDKLLTQAIENPDEYNNNNEIMF